MAYSKKYKDFDYMKNVVLSQIPCEPCGIHSKDIARNIGEKERDIRFIIQKLRDDGVAICATPQDGYWVARTSWDLNETINTMRNHILNCQDTLDALLQAQAEIERKENGNC